MEQNSTQNTAGCMAAGSPSQRHSIAPGCSVTVGGETFQTIQKNPCISKQTALQAGGCFVCLGFFFQISSLF